MAISANTTVMRTTRGTGRYRQLVACFMPPTGACCPASTCGSLVIMCSPRRIDYAQLPWHHHVVTMLVLVSFAQEQSLLLRH